MNGSEQAARHARLERIDATLRRHQQSLDTVADDIRTLLNGHAEKQQAWVVQQLSDHRALLDKQFTDELNAIVKAADKRITRLERATINLNFLGRLRFLLTGRL